MWDDDFFLYHEDLEWSLRLKMAGYRIVMVTDSIFYHKYKFSRSITKFYWMERNRYGVLLMFFRWKTLLLLLPMLLVMELGLIAFALKGGWIKDRIRVYQYWSKLAHWKLWLGKRKKINAIRKVSGKKDIDILQSAATKILFQDQEMQNPLLIYVGNPIMNLYAGIIRHIIKW